MRASRFNHLFTFLMLLSFLGAFVIPPAYSQRFKPNVQSLFVPVSWPAGGLGRWISGRFGDDGAPVDRRAIADVRAENAALRTELSNLTARLKTELDRTASRGAFPIALVERGVFVSVAGGDAGTRQTLQLRGPIPSAVADGMYATYPSGVVGVVRHPSLSGAHVRLVTDIGFRVRCGFARLRKRPDGTPEMIRIATSPVVVEGAGDNTLAVVKTGMTVEDAAKAGLTDQAGEAVEGLWAFVDDPDWPEVLKGQLVGEVDRIAPRKDMPLFAEVTLCPATNLTRLREVLVVTKE
jgi:hypothetical protein